MVDFRHGVLVALVAWTSALAPAHGEEPEPAGMVIKVTGATTPDLPLRAEIPSNTVIRLGQEVELTFLHYGKCKLVTVVGGTLELSKRGFTTDGKVESEAAGPCPRVYQLQGSAGGWVSRDLPSRLPVDAEVIFAGKRADRVIEAAVYTKDQSDHPLFRFDLANRRATEPTAGALSADRSYVLRVRMSDQPNPIEHSFVAVAPAAHSSIVVLRID
jgi:hypothetical protein